MKLISKLKVILVFLVLLLPIKSYAKFVEFKDRLINTKQIVELKSIDVGCFVALSNYGVAEHNTEYTNNLNHGYLIVRDMSCNELLIKLKNIKGIDIE